MPMPKKRRKLKFIFIFVLVLFISGAWGIYSLLRNLPRPERIIERNVVESTKIYDRTGKILLYEIHGEEKRTLISLQDVPDHVKKATLAAEDINFYQHRGLDWRGITRAVLNNLLNRELSQGGSTITQQLVKNSLLGPEKTFRRKIREQILAVLLEQKYSKDQILEMYLNQIPYGSNAYGIESAAKTYFDKSTRELNLNEAAVLAALPKAPTYYSPYGSRKEELYKRKNKILEKMAEAGFVGRIEAEQAKTLPLFFQPIKYSFRAPHFIMFVRDYLNSKYGESFVEQGGLKVVTTLDWPLQEEAERVVKEHAEKNRKTINASNASLTAVDPRSGEILVMVGSRSYWDKPDPENCTPGVNCRFDPHVNVTTRLRQPGSAFKPFVYATAFKKGFTPETVVFDAPTEFNPRCAPDGTQKKASELKYGDCYSPQNYDGKYRGPVTLRQALGQSLNVPSVKVLYLAGIQDSIKTAQNLGITSLNEPNRYGLSLVLGGAEVSLLEMTSAFGVFAQEGFLHPKIPILKIENSKGEVLEEKREETIPVLDTEVARTINDVLSDNEARIPMFHPRSSLYFPDRQVAVKTGTTQDARDAWVIGYTPSLAVGVWVGNSNNESMHKSVVSVIAAGPLWHQFLEFASKNTIPESFIKPENKNPNKSVLRGVYRSGTVFNLNKINKKLATPSTPPELIEEVGVGEIKSILAQIKKEDPLGDPPQNPEEDLQYKNWQWAINYWLQQNFLPEPKPTKELDDFYSPDKLPKITFTTPKPEEEKTEKLEKISFKTDSFYPLKEVTLFIDDDLVGSQTSIFLQKEFSFSLTKTIPQGDHRIKAIIYDSFGNKVVSEKKIIVSD